MGTLYQDLKYGLRMLWKNPGFTFVAVLALALGIGANTAIFSVVNGVLLRPLPFADAQQLVAIYGTNAGGAATGRMPLSYPDFTDYKKQMQTMEHLAAYETSGTSLASGGGEPERIIGASVSAELFLLLGAKPELGRVFTSEEDQPGSAPVIVLSHGLWQRRFNSDREIIGREIALGSRSATVLGVMPADFKFPIEQDRHDFWMPYTPDLAGDGSSYLTGRDTRFLTAIAKLKPDVTLEQAQVEMSTVASRLEAQYPASNTGRGIRLVSLHEDIVGDVKPALLILLGAVGLVLLIACANVASLLLARATGRVKEMAIRTALGASRGRIIRQLLTESLLLSCAGGILGFLVAMWSVDLIVAAGPADIPRLTEIRLDAGVLAFAFGVSILTGLVFGIAPALTASNLNLNESLKDGGRSSTPGVRGSRVRSVLVVSEIALSLVLLIGGGLLVKSFYRLLQTDLGYDTARVLALNVPLSKAKYPDADSQARFFQEAVRRIGTVSGVEAVGATNLLPLSGRDTYNTFNIEGRPRALPGAELAARSQVISPDYFRAMSTDVRKGRAFTERDEKNAPPVIIVNETFTRSHFAAGEDPLGKRILTDADEEAKLPPREIVGIVGDVRQGGFDAKVAPAFYLPYLQSPVRQMDIVVRSTLPDAAALTPAVRGAIKEVNSNQLIWEARTMRDLLAQSTAPRRFNMLLLAAFALVALTLAAIGIYGVMSYSVTQRTHEIGVRLALGAQSRDVLRLVVGRGMMLTLIGVGLGLLTALVMTRLMIGLLYGVSATDPVTFGGVTVLLISVAFLASYIPARRATKVDPMIALRYE